MNIKKVYERIEKEVHRWVEVPSESSTPFEVSREFNTMNLQFETDDPSEFFILLFSRMSNFYEKGFLFERGVPSATKDSSPSKSESDPWICSIAFNEGKVFLLSPSLEAEVPLPALDANKVTVSFPKDWELKSP